MLFCLERSVSSLKNNECIVFLHGFLGNSHDWDQYLNHFSLLGFNCIAIDLPGHGNSPLCEIEDFFSVIPYKAHVVGYSMGGRIALLLDSLKENWFSSLTLISTNPGLRTEEEIKKRKAWDNTWSEKLINSSLHNFVNDWYKQPLFSSYTPTEIRYQQKKNLLLAAFRKFSIANLPSLWDYLPKVCKPTLMLFGESDLKYMSLKKEVEEIDTLSTIKLATIKGCSHPLHLEAPDRVISEVENLTRMAIGNA